MLTLSQTVTFGDDRGLGVVHRTNVTELRLVGSAHPTADQGFRRSVRVNFRLCQGHSSTGLLASPVRTSPARLSLVLFGKQGQTLKLSENEGALRIGFELFSDRQGFVKGR